MILVYIYIYIYIYIHKHRWTEKFIFYFISAVDDQWIAVAAIPMKKCVIQGGLCLKMYLISVSFPSMNFSADPRISLSGNTDTIPIYLSRHIDIPIIAQCMNYF